MYMTSRDVIRTRYPRVNQIVDFRPKNMGQTEQIYDFERRIRFQIWHIFGPTGPLPSLNLYFCICISFRHNIEQLARGTRTRPWLPPPPSPRPFGTRSDRPAQVHSFLVSLSVSALYISYLPRYWHRRRCLLMQYLTISCRCKKHCSSVSVFTPKKMKDYVDSRHEMVYIQIEFLIWKEFRASNSDSRWRRCQARLRFPKSPVSLPGKIALFEFSVLYWAFQLSNMANCIDPQLYLNYVIA